MLDDAAEMELLPSTILRNEKNKPRAAQLNTLQYLFEFLDAYDFAGEGSEEIQEESKTLINASVLGLIFEKINGYKDGSIFTPGFITMYMCRQAIRQSILNKFTETYHWKADAFEDLYNYISEDRSAKKLKEYNALVNSITLCDPAVGSGHFLVSALNELIYIKAGLGILTDEQGKRLAEADIKLENDELLVFDKQGDPFTYTLQHGEGGKPYITPWKQTLQKTLFHEKQTLIEHCLFGVDVNPKSVQICRLRLWIELLKHAYYTETGELQTLPNIDINIKCGNSLISRFALNEDLTTVFRQSKYSVETYKTVVQAYKESRNREEKEQLQQFVKELKEQFRTMVYQRDPLRKKIADLRGQLLLLENNIDLFGNRKKTDKELAAEKKKLTQALTERETELAEKENSKIYNNAFEWRFEFPEVLNDKGEYIGFDVVIGNPPYIRQEEVKHLSSYFENNYKTFSGKADVYVYFYEKGVNILKENGVITYITSGKFFEANYGKNLTTFLLDTLEIREIVDFKDLPVFDGVTAYPLIFNAKKQIKDDYDFSYIVMSELPKEKLENLIHDTHPLLTSRVIFKNNNYKFVNSRTAQLLEKINQNSVSIEDFCGLPVVGIKTGYNEGFLTSIKDDKFVKPYVFGRDIKKYKTVNPPESIIFPYDGDFNIVQFNSHSDIYSQSLRFKDNLSKRAIISEGLKSGIKEWYEYQQINKTLDYNSEYIVYPNVSLGNNFTFSKGNAIDMTGFVIKSNNRYLLAILNSKLVEFLMGIWSIGRRGGYLEYKVQYISKIPVKKISESEQVPFVKLVEEIYSSKSNQVLSIERKIDQLVYQLYGLTEAEIAIVEGRG